MHRSEGGQTDACSICGEELDPDDPMTYSVSSSTLVCSSCTAKAGGVYDSETERWKLSPRLEPLEGHKSRED